VGRIAFLIAVSYASVVALTIVFFVWIGLSTRAKRRLVEPDPGKLGEREKTWFAIVVVLLAALLFSTILFTPYGHSSGKNEQIENIKAIQFAWIVPGTPIKAGTPIKFRLTSADVNHGFAVYNSAGTLLFEVQVEPSRTQEYVYTFRKPGTYTILCTEFCGVSHAQMQSRLTVTA
jgi:cytochrome c oxidase subunit 2